MTSITPISGSDFSGYDGGNYQAMSGIASSTNGAIIYVSLNGGPNNAVIKSTNSGSTWNSVYPNSMGFTSIACSSDGNIVYAANLLGCREFPGILCIQMYPWYRYAVKK